MSPRLWLGVAVVLALITAACGGPPAVSTPALVDGSSPGAGSQAPNGVSPSTASASPGGSPGALPSSALGGPEPGPLPEPTLTDPFAIGEALYDPTRQAEAIVSVLDMLRVGIYAADGTSIRAGAEQDADDLWLTDDEVRGLIAMGETDSLVLSGEDGGAPPMTVADLHAALAPMLPGDFSAQDFAAAYDEAYTDHPDELVAQVMLGQPITPETPLTRVQSWLLYVDGFVAPTGLHARRPALAGRGPAGGPGRAPAAIGRIRVPTLFLMDPRWSSAELSLVLGHVMLLGWTIPFEVQPLVSQVHEGHGGEGPPVALKAVHAWGSWAVLVSPLTGLPLIVPRPTTLDGLTVTWGVGGVSALQKHGTVDVPPTFMAETDMSGAVKLTFTPRREPADGRGEQTSEVVPVEASAEIRELVLQHYDIPVEAFGLISGQRTAKGYVDVSWHAGGLKLDLSNEYRDIQIVVGTAFAQGTGNDKATGFLARLDDGTYRGFLEASVSGSFTGAAMGVDCSDTFSGTQRLLAFGQPDPLGATVSLRFYPVSAPSLSTGSCTTPIPFPGGGPDFQPAGRFLPFNDTRWTTQIGFTIDVAPSGILDYRIPSPAGLRGSSTWTVHVERVDVSP